MISEITISIIIVTYNSEQFIINCLNSIFDSVLNNNFEVIIIDNNSIDFTTSIIRTNYSSVILIENLENIGFAKANNQALKFAKGKYVFLLNPDTEIPSDALNKFYNYLEEENNENIWCLGGQLVDEYGNPSKSFGKFPNIFDVFLEQLGIKGILLKLFGKNLLSKNRWITTSKEVPFVMGCNMFIRKNALEDIGYFNESFFLNYEEVELCWRAKKWGGKNIVFPEVRIVHFAGKSFTDIQEYLNQLWLGQIRFFKLTRSKIYFLTVKGIHLAGALLRYLFKLDENYLNQLKKILEIN